MPCLHRHASLRSLSKNPAWLLVLLAAADQLASLPAGSPTRLRPEPPGSQRLAKIDAVLLLVAAYPCSCSSLFVTASHGSVESYCLDTQRPIGLNRHYCSYPQQSRDTHTHVTGKPQGEPQWVKGEGVVVHHHGGYTARNWRGDA